MSRRNGRSTGRGAHKSNIAKKSSNSCSTSSSSSSHFKDDGSIVNLIFANGYDIDSSNGDGNCLFRSLSTALTGEELYHLGMRQLIVAELGRCVPNYHTLQNELQKQDQKDGKKSNSNRAGLDEEELGGRRSRQKVVLKSKKGKDQFRSDLINSELHIPDYHFFVLGPFDEYCHRMSSSTVWGGHLELQAAANVFGAKIVVLQDQFRPIIVNPDRSIWPDDPTLALHMIYRGNCHYDAVIPDTQRQINYEHSRTKLALQRNAINDRHGKLLQDIPIQLTLVEPVGQSWWLTTEGMDQTKEIGEAAKQKVQAKKSGKKYASNWSDLGFDSQDDDYGGGGGGDDDDDGGDGVGADIKRAARPVHCDCDGDACLGQCGSSNPADQATGGNDEDGSDDGQCGVIGETGNDKKKKSSRKSSSTSSSSKTIPVVSLSFPGQPQRNPTKSSTLLTSVLSTATIDEADGFDSFIGASTSMNDDCGGGGGVVAAAHDNAQGDCENDTQFGSLTEKFAQLTITSNTNTDTDCIPIITFSFVPPSTSKRKTASKSKTSSHRRVGKIMSSATAKKR